jgi:Oxidoreductase family, NAD-binding Rossmann fold
MRTIRWGIIGCGDVTEVKSGPGFQKANHSRLVAVMRRTGELARDYARRHGVPRWYDNAEALINDPEVDAVYIATPPVAHKDYTLLCARAGKPVYVEKPMALNYQECQFMLRACRAAGLPLFVAYYRRALPRFLKVKQLIDTHAIGEVRSFRKWLAVGGSWTWLRICWTFSTICLDRFALFMALPLIKPTGTPRRTSSRARSCLSRACMASERGVLVALSGRISPRSWALKAKLHIRRLTASRSF